MTLQPIKCRSRTTQFPLLTVINQLLPQPPPYHSSKTFYGGSWGNLTWESGETWPDHADVSLGNASTGKLPPPRSVHQSHMTAIRLINHICTLETNIICQSYLNKNHIYVLSGHFVSFSSVAILKIIRVSRTSTDIYCTRRQNQRLIHTLGQRAYQQPQRLLFTMIFPFTAIFRSKWQNSSRPEALRNIPAPPSSLGVNSGP